MKSELGRLLREIRTARQLSLSGLSSKTTVAKATLSRWETGAHQPRLPELEVVLKALEVTPQQHEQMLALVDAPRTTARIRRQAERIAHCEQTHFGRPPLNGDLLRAMRYREGLSLEQVARALRVQPSTVSRWERSEAAPSEDRRQELLELLNAQPEEKMALAGNVLLALTTCSPTVDVCNLERQTDELIGVMLSGTLHLADLRFLTIEAQLWPCAPESHCARRALARAYTGHSLLLLWRNRIAEAGELANRALQILSGYPPESFWAYAIHVCGAAAAHGTRHALPARGVELLKSWIGVIAQPDMEAWMYRDIADYLSKDGRIEPALDWSARACTLLQQTDFRGELRHAHFDRALILLRAGQPEQALPLLPLDTSLLPVQGAREALTWAETLLLLDKKEDAREWLDQAYTIIHTNKLTAHYADQLALRMQ